MKQKIQNRDSQGKVMLALKGKMKEIYNKMYSESRLM
jgi:hypothetical protein